MAAIKHLFHIAASREKVFDAITHTDQLARWWTIQTSGDSKPGGIIQFRFGEFGNDMKVTEMKKNELLKWECVAGPEDWIGTIIQFQLDDNDGKTRIRFEHDNWKATDDFYASCSFSWGRYMESLRQLCQTGKGQAYGSEAYK